MIRDLTYEGRSLLRRAADMVEVAMLAVEDERTATDAVVAKCINDGDDDVDVQVERVREMEDILAVLTDVALRLVRISEEVSA